MSDLKTILHGLYALDAPSLREITETCVRCGHKGRRLTRDPHAPGHRDVVCSACAESDHPTQYPDTGWTQ